MTKRKKRKVKSSRRIPSLYSRRDCGIPMLLFPSFVFLEIMAHGFLFGFHWNTGYAMTVLMGAFFGALFSGLVYLLPKKAQYGAAVALCAAAGVYFSFHLVYYANFHTFFAWKTLGLAKDVKDFWREALAAVWKNFGKVLTMFLPLAAGILLRHLTLPKKFPGKELSLGSAAALLILASVLIGKIPANREAFLYLRTDPPRTFSIYGIMTTTCIDVGQCIFGEPEEKFENPFEDTMPWETKPITKQTSGTDSESPSEGSESTPPEEPISYEDNVLPYDVEKLIAEAPNDTIRAMHQYFFNAQPTAQNAYTGMFAGKNLIFLTLEGFSDKIIDPERTPILYRMATEGFRFTNFYDSIWGGSTATGEYANLTGNIYTTADCFQLSAGTAQPFAMGNLFRNAGYATYAFHNHTATYYGRNLSHPNFGFDIFKALGTGMVLKSALWPNSDYEMAVASEHDYMDSSEPFLAYYMTVSGHANYDWIGNSMSARHRWDTPGPKASSETIQAYYAAQYEVELMLEELVATLEAQGMLENTVFAMCCDHYPYALTDSELAELYGLPADGIRNTMDLYRNGFILWSASMEEPVVVDTPCSAYDMLPTLANLFGLSYDSRLMIGKDILSEGEKIVILNCSNLGGSWCWITEQGSYYTGGGRFTPSENCTIAETEYTAYVYNINRKVAAMRQYAEAILKNNYYRYLHF